MKGIWYYFRWTTPELPELGAALESELRHRRKPLEQFLELDGSDHGERWANREWAHELAATLNQWTSTLEISPDGIPGYSKASRQAVWNEAFIPITPIIPHILSVLRARAGSDDEIFRPLCLERANNEIMKWLSSHPEHIDRIHHRTFESIIAEVIKAHGWEVELTKRTRDGGYDLLCLKNESLGFPLVMIVEAKLYNISRAVGLPMVDRLLGVASRVNPNKAVLVTNSRFTNEVWKQWESRVGRDLELIDREDLFNWLRTYSSFAMPKDE